MHRCGLFDLQNLIFRLKALFFDKSYHSVKSTIFHDREAPFRLSFSRERKPQKERGPTGENRGREKIRTDFCRASPFPLWIPPFYPPREAGQRRGVHFPIPRMSPKNENGSPTNGSDFARLPLPQDVGRKRFAVGKGTGTVSFHSPIAWHLIGSSEWKGWHISDKPRASERILYCRSKPGPFPEAQGTLRLGPRLHRRNPLSFSGDCGRRNKESDSPILGNIVPQPPPDAF